VQSHWVSCSRFTVRVDVVDGVIVRGAPLVRRFVGQRLDNLLHWARSIGGLRHEVLLASTADWIE